jgi:hypothetical protein
MIEDVQFRISPELVVDVDINGVLGKCEMQLSIDKAGDNP